jgi:hypothetical protein
MAATAIAADRGAGDARKLLEHPEAGPDLFVEALRLTFAQILAAPTLIEHYPMPVKRGSIIDAAVINPFMPSRNDEDRKRSIARYENFLRGDRIEIWTKRQNTLKFLKLAEAAQAAFLPSLDSGDYPKET